MLYSSRMNSSLKSQKVCEALAAKGVKKKRSLISKLLLINIDCAEESDGKRKSERLKRIKLAFVDKKIP